MTDLIDDAGQLAPGLRAFHLQLPRRDVEVVGDLLQDANEDHVHAARVLQLVQPRDHLARVQPVGAAHIFLAAAFGERLGCCSAQRKQRRLIAVMLSTNSV